VCVTPRRERRDESLHSFARESDAYVSSRLASRLPCVTNSAPSRWTIAALLVLAAPAVWLGVIGAGALWPRADLAWHLFFAALSLGWHAAWLGAVVAGRRRLWITPAWIASVEIVRRGLDASGFAATPWLWALGLEATLLGVALQWTPGVAAPERLARWRRTADDLLAQLRLGPGLLPWIASCVRIGLRGAPADTPPLTSLAAAVQNAEARLGVRLSHGVLPEHVRQSLLTRASELNAQAELVTVEAGLGLELEALTAAAAFRDECRRLDDLTEEERDTLARTGQAFLLESAAVPATTGSLHSRRNGTPDGARS
jgi:hypothetical protein